MSPTPEEPPIAPVVPIEKPALSPNAKAPKTIDEVNRPKVEREANRPTVDGGKLLVFIVTPLREFPTPEAWEALSIEQRALHMPKPIRLALHELATRGNAGHLEQLGELVAEEVVQGHVAFRVQADKYTFEWAVAVGGMCRARNGAVHEFQKAKGHFLLWWDSDLEPDGMTAAEAILRLLSHRLPIVGGMYCKREAGKRPTWACSFMAAAEMQKEKTREDLVQVAELAGGFTCFFWRTYSEVGRLMPKLTYRDRDTGEQMVAFYQNLNLDGDFLSEDYWFNYLCRCSVIAIWADTKLKLRHVEVDEKGERHLYPSDEFPPIQAVEAAEDAKS